MKNSILVVASLVVGLVMGAETAPTPVQEPVRVGVFVGRGAYGTGMLRWVQLACRSPELKPTYIDGEAVRAGVLDKLDLVVMPGGAPTREYNDLGSNGVARLKAFIHRGGGYIGACAGCFLVMQGGTPERPRMGIIPYVSQKGPYRYGSILSTKYTPAAEGCLGIKPGYRRVRYHGGPIMLPGTPIPDAKFEVMSTYVGDINPGSPDPVKPMTGAASEVAGTYGKGRVVAFADHPEYFPNTLDIVRGAFRYVIGREIHFDIPRRQAGQLSVGLYGDASIGVESANACRALFQSDAADVVLLNNDDLAEGMLRHVDVLVLPDMGVAPPSLRESVYKQSRVELFEAFTARGGRILTWGDSALVYPGDRRLVKEIAPTNLVAEVKALQNCDFQPPPAITKHVRTAVYAGPGVCCAEYFNVTKLLEFSPLYDVAFVDGKDVENGVLKDFDLFVMGGGSPHTEYNSLGEQGRKNVVEFVRNGGAYYGICAGAFLALQTRSPNFPHLGLVPFKEQPEKVYRGWSEMSVRFTDWAGELGFVGSSRRFVLYWSGPVMLPGDPMPDTDVKVLARYHGNVVNTFSGKPIDAMTGHACIVGGRVGKGRVIASGPHPEASESTQDFVRGFLRFLTGVPAEPVYPNRKVGALNVAFDVEWATKEGMAFGMSLLRDPRFDVLPNTPYETGHGALDHADVLLMPGAITGGYMSLVHDFIAKGGIVVEYDPESKGKFTGKGFHHAKNYDEVLNILLKQRK